MWTSFRRFFFWFVCASQKPTTDAQHDFAQNIVSEVFLDIFFFRFCVSSNHLSCSKIFTVLEKSLFILFVFSFLWWNSQSRSYSSRFVCFANNFFPLLLNFAQIRWLLPLHFLCCILFLFYGIFSPLSAMFSATPQYTFVIAVVVVVVGFASCACSPHCCWSHNMYMCYNFFSSSSGYSYFFFFFLIYVYICILFCSNITTDSYLKKLS